MLPVLPKMFDLDGHVVGHAGKFRVKRRHKFERVAYPVEKVRIAKGNMLRPSRYLRADIRHHHYAINNPKHAVVNGHNGAMAAKMLAAPAGLGGSHNAMPISRNDQMRIIPKRRHPRPVRHLEGEPLK